MASDGEGKEAAVKVGGPAVAGAAVGAVVGGPVGAGVGLVVGLVAGLFIKAKTDK